MFELIAINQLLYISSPTTKSQTGVSNLFYHRCTMFDRNRSSVFTTAIDLR